MFKEKQLVMYGTTGVCRVVEIGTPDFASEEGRKYYYLEPIYQSGMIYAPVDNERIPIRAIVSKKEANELIDGIGKVRVKSFTPQSLQQLSQHYQGIIDKHSCQALIELIKAVNKKEKDAIKKNKKLGQIDRRYLKLAEDLLYGELAASLGKEKQEIAQMVGEKL